MFLLDTMVISEPGKRRPSASVTAWIAATPGALFYVSTISFGEITAGIEKKRSIAADFSDRLDRWELEVREDFQQRTLPVTTEVALRWGVLAYHLKRRDTDLLIAATALVHDLIVVTRNIRHFEPTGAKVLNPYED